MQQGAIRYLWMAGGGVALALALAGIVLPIMPTVPFALVAAFCFARSSKKIHAWIMNHPVFGPSIRDWQERGAIGVRAKWIATASFIGSVTLGLILAFPFWVVGTQAAILVACAGFIWSRPSA